jgi:hypothetical protein
MNVLILTPKRTGSTLLQRALTIYMQQKKYDKPVVDLHNIGLGISLHYNHHLNQPLLRAGSENFQSLSEIANLLSSTNQYSVCKLSHRVIKQRQDSVADQIKFYNYLNKNFYIIKSNRENIFEYALSWCISSHSKTVNVFDNHSKYNTFKNFYQNKINIFQESLVGYLNKYIEYCNWVDEYFDVQSHFTYENSYTNLEEYILNLDFMKDSPSKTWNNIYNQSFNDWNLCHYIAGNLEVSKSVKTGKYIATSKTHIEDWKKLKGTNWPELTDNIHSDIELLPKNIKNEIYQLIDISSIAKELPNTPQISNFLDKHLSAYTTATFKIKNLVENGILPSEIPIKLHTINDKEKIIENFDQCVGWYNKWAIEHNYKPVTYIQSQNNIELLGYNPYPV